MTDAPRRPWTADVELSPRQAADRIAASFPDLPAPRLELIGRGWDNDAYLVDGRFVFRFPRRKIAALCMRHEIASLPQLAASLPPGLPLRIPRLTHVGEPDAGYPYPFAGYERLAGRTACAIEFDEKERARCAEPLAVFLAALHAVPVPADAPEDPAGSKNVAMLVEKTLAALARIPEAVDSALGVPARIPHQAEKASAAPARNPVAVEKANAEADRARQVTEGLARTAEWDGEARWVHGDLYARHVLVDGAKRPCAVIDWGDVHAGEIADDLSIAYAFLPPEARGEFFGAYGEVDGATRDRARLYALHSGAVVLGYGLEIGDGDLAGIGRIALGFATR
jgi:aminoglycoside phosphotransferase (APT) family kinase protein